MMEIRTETDYVAHHIQKVMGFFAAMRAFKEHFASQGFKFIYLTLDDKANLQDFSKNLDQVITKEKITNFEMIEPDEYRLDQYFKKYLKLENLIISYNQIDTNDFLSLYKTTIERSYLITLESAM